MVRQIAFALALLAAGYAVMVSFGLFLLERLI